MAELTGKIFAGYEVISKLGQGGMGAVYKARQPVLDRVVALKVIATQVAQDPSFIARFQHEAKSAARLNHSNIVQVYAAGEDSGTHFMVTEFVEGESLHNRLAREGRMDPQEALATCVFVAEGLKHAWDEARIIHRDIKPDNIFLSVKGVVKVGDLGLAKSVGQEAGAALTQSGITVGTPFYCSPEQAKAEKEIDFRADIYSLGCTLYHMLSGKRPYDSGQNQSPMSVMVKQVHDPSPEVLQVWPECPMPLVMMLSKMLKKNPNERHQSYEELIEEMRQMHEQLGQPQADVPQPLPHAMEPKDASHKRLSMVIVGIAAVVMAAGLLLWAPWKQSGASSATLGSAGILPAEDMGGKPKETPKPPATLLEKKEQTLVAEATPSVPAATPPPKAGKMAALPDTDSAIQSRVRETNEVNPKSKIQISPASIDDAWLASVATLPAEEQIQRVMTKLKKLNPNFDNRETHTIRESAVTQLAISTVGVKDISPLRALRQLDEIRCSGTQEEPSPLSDLSPLHGLSLRHLACDFTAVSDLTPLTGMPLAFLDISGTPVTDLSPLADLPLTELRCPPAAARNKDIAQLLLKLSTLQRVNGQSPAAFLASLARMPAAEPANEMVASPVAPVEDPFVRTVTVLPAEQQVTRVMARLKELNPQFDGKETHKVEAGAVTELSFSTVGVTDITPLKALKWLKKLAIVPPTLNQKGALADLAPLQGLPLTWLWCHGNPITDLTPLREMPLTVLSFSGTQVSDLSPLIGMKLGVLSFSDTAVADLVPLERMPLTVLWCNNTKVTDLGPIESAPLQELKCDFVPTRDAAVLRGIKTLTKINDMAAGMFWIRVGPIAATAATRQPTAAAATMSGAQKTLITSTGMELVWIPPGEFLMGSAPEERAWAVSNGCSQDYVSHEGQSKATIRQAFWLGRTEATVGQWKQFASATGYVTDAERNGWSIAPNERVQGANWRDPKFGFAPKDNHPVCCVSWNDAVAFCAWLTEKEKKANRLPVGVVCRLPTEAEWEYACRAGKYTKFWWGDTVDGGEKRLNWKGTGDEFDFVSPVDHYGMRGRNKFGLADMLGNVREWCLDGYDPAGAHETLCKENTARRMLRGGSFNHPAGVTRCAVREQIGQAFSYSTLGFRVCLGVPEDSAEAAGASTTVSTATKASPPPVAPVSVGASTVPPLTTSTGMELVWIPPGEFALGSTEEEQAWAVAHGLDARFAKFEGVQMRKVTMKKGFWLGRTELTIRQWKQFTSATGYVTDAEKLGKSPDKLSVKKWGMATGINWKDPKFDSKPKDRDPVSCVSWNDAAAFCEWLTETEKKINKLPAEMIYRLPTEAEWEYACRAGTQTKFWWGDTIEGGDGRLNWGVRKGSFEFVSPVDYYGARGRNKFGLADMLGNVWEWCLDGLDTAEAHGEYYNKNSSGRMLRGGSFRHAAGDCRCARRRALPPSFVDNCVGLRVCLGVPEDSAEAAGASTTVSTATKASPPPVVPVSGGASTVPPLITSTGMELVWIPPGEFLLGSTKEERAWALQNGCVAEGVKREGEAPRKAAIKQGFWMGRAEVAVGQWKLFVAATGYVTEGEKKGASYTTPGPGQNYGLVKGASWKDPNFGFKLKDDHPVSCISWNDAMAFCTWLNEQEAKAGRLPTGFKVRLPTEAEWEYACRAGKQTKFWWGETKEDGDNRLNWRGKDDGFEFVSPVDHYGSRGRNKFGLADMLGNVWEWCLDECDETQAHEECYKGDPSHRVLRGGSFHSFPGFDRCACRFTYAPTHSDSFNGFRVVVGVER